MAEVIGGESSPTTPPAPAEQPAKEEPALGTEQRPLTATMRSCCRICLASGSIRPMVSIHRPVPEYAEKTLLHMLLTLCLPLNQRGSLSGLPEQICRNCHWKLLSAYDLYETSLASDAQLRAGGPQGANDLFKHSAVRPRLVTVAQVKQEGRSNDGTDEDQPYHHPQQSVMVEMHEPMGDGHETGGLLSGTLDSLGDLLEETKESVPDPMESFMEEHYEFDELAGSHGCGLCKATFPYKSQCRMHIATKHNPAKPFKCDVCFCTLTSLHRLQRHKALAHDVGQVKQEDAIEEHDNDTGEKTYACPICGKKFSTAVRFKRHKSVHAVHNRPFKCETCLYRFASKSQLTQHAKVHREQAVDGGDGSLFGCDQCNEQFPGKRALTVHQRRVHGKDGSRGDDEGRERTDYACIICKSSFARESVLNTHMKMHELLAAEKEKEKRLDLERMVKQELQHQMALNNVGPPLPPLSPELLEPSSSVLEPFALGLVPVIKDSPAGDAGPQQTASTASTTAGAPAAAAAAATSSSSSNTVFNNSIRKTAMRLSISASTSTPVEKKKPPATTTDIVYVCSMCEQEFEEREQLKKHQKRQHRKLKVDIVSTETPSNGGGGGDHPPPAQRRKLLNGDCIKQDDEEDDSFTGFPQELEEMDDDSMTDRKGSAADSPFVCDLCNKSFTHNCYLTMHKRKHHDPAKQYGCKVCHYRFGYRGSLMRHQLIHSSQSVLPGAHGSIIFKCRICSAKFLELMHLNSHLKSHRQPEEPPAPESGAQVQLIRCSECTQVFIDRAQFEEHKMKAHPPSQSGQSFSTNSRSAEAPQSHRLLLHDKSSSFRPVAATSGQSTRPYDEPRMLTFPSTSSPFASSRSDSKLHYEPAGEDEDDEFLNGLSIIKMEPAAE
ncbi:zinc finger protein 84-like [Anopheles albimanus]|uniref:Uncharacterized protein n=1 Tax=Anopheles albimanus TaxID=7167 RepID=A0A182FV50_ANOAL|nr:zinc finger protein 84-like [Anopheles albimanus]